MDSMPVSVPRRPKRPPRVLTVLRSRYLTPHMIRVTLTGDDLADFPEGQNGAHCKILMPEPGETEETFRARLNGPEKPVIRTYTIRDFRPDSRELDIDFAVHGDAGPANRWAQEAGPGTLLGLLGPGTKKLTTWDADWYLLAADMTALPVIGVALEEMPRDARGHAIIEVTSEADIQPLDAPEGVAITWKLLPHPEERSAAQLDFLAALDWPEGRVRVGIAGESGTIVGLRDWLRARGVPMGDCYISGYWKIGLVEDEHQIEKRRDNAAAAAADAAAAAG
ncbi:siderophore-interacting protein [Oceanicella sp. SM1341]|uniref:siderophore-interacting protein n=1 Tax=Oceanicella sp. SM1341 TaxID=1548889 RepID=UPI001E397CF7|nr:siderophore-interacting protein [Oceanicella sp. SM1341]